MAKKKMELKSVEEPKARRKIAEIQQEYQQLCLRAGHTQYQLYTLKKDMELINDSLRNLNAEATAVKPLEDAENAKAAAEAAKKAKEEKKESPSV